jgi:hypothetical protein
MVSYTTTLVAVHVQALHIYEDTVGRKHRSYYTTLTNLGIVYKEKASKSSGMDKRNLVRSLRMHATNVVILYGVGLTRILGCAA